MTLASAILLLLPAVPVQQAPLPQGVTVLESRDMAAELRDVRVFLAQGNYSAAAATLQRILDADPALLIRPGIDLLYRGAVQEARAIAASLPPEAREAREALVGRRAANELRAALEPPDPEALRRVARLYAGTRAAAQAEQVLQEVLLDRGLLEQAAAGRPLEEVLPEDWAAALPAPRPAAPLRMPAVESPRDPALPVVRASGAHERWSYRFSGIETPLPQGYGMHRMALGGGTGYLTDSREVVALDLATGGVKWRFAGPAGWGRLNPRLRVQLREGFNYDTLLAPVLADGVVVAPIQEPVLLGRSQDFAHIPVRRYLPGRRLYAFDARTGEVLWKQSVEWMDGRHAEPRGLVAAPPAIAAGRVFVPIYDAVGTLDLHLAALDLYTGQLLWKTFLVSGQRETNLFGNVLEELATNPPVADASRVLMCTNLGAVCALDAASGAVIWTRIYERTPVDTYQTGDPSRREDTFANCPPAYDGTRFVCSPTDSYYALALGAENGESLGRWRTGDRFYGELRCLVAALPGGAIFNGTRLAFLPLRAREGRGWRSSNLYQRFHLPDHRRGAVLARDELLVPTAEGVLRFDPSDGSEGGRAFSWSPNDSGALQAAPGLLLVLDSRGVTAYASPDALLETLLAAGDEPERLAQTLPFLEALHIEEDPAKALRVARASERLAARTGNREQEERLRLVAARAYLDARHPEQAAAAAETVLPSRDPERRIRAAVTLLDALERRDPAAPLLGRALALLSRLEGQTEIRRYGGAEPVAYSLARAGYLGARARGDLDAQRRSLLDILRLPVDDTVREEGLPLTEWAAARLRELLAAEPEQALALEREAARAFRRGPVDEETVRAFAGTPTVRRWLLEEIRKPGLPRRERVLRSAWLRDYLQPDERAGLLDRDALFGHPQLPRLPERLAVLATVTLDSGQFLRAAPAPGGARFIVKDGADLVLHQVSRGGDAVLFRQPLDDPDLNVLGLEHRSLFSETGVTVVANRRWLRFGFDGSVDRVLLPGRADVPYRLGRMAAVVCSNAPDSVRIQIRDLETAALFYEVRLDLESGGLPVLTGSPAALAILEAGNLRGTLLSPLADNAARPLMLPWAPTAREVKAAVPWGGGIVLPSLRAGRHAVLLVQPEETLTLPQPADALLMTFSAPGGAGWLLKPFTVASGPFPWPVVAWLPQDGSRSYDTELQSTYQLNTDLLERFKGRRLDSSRLLFTSRGDRRLLRLMEVDLEAAAAGRPPVLWTRDVEKVPHSRLKRVQPRPLRGQEGWFSAFALAETRQEAERIYCLLLGPDGAARDVFECPPPDRQSRISAWPGRDSVLLRCGARLYLLGDS